MKKYILGLSLVLLILACSKTQEEININKERCYMEQELSTLIGRVNASVGDCEGALETLMILNKLGVIE